MGDLTVLLLKIMTHICNMKHNNESSIYIGSK